jgi:dolichol-phosphate mannosyltransferase
MAHDADPAPEVSVVVPLFNEQDNLPELYRRTVDALDALGVTFELLLIDDGSSDATGELADDHAAHDARVGVVHLSRNFGHQAALTAGLDHARGRAVVLMDGDLQDPPEALGDFLDAWRGGAEVVYAVRARRKEPLWKRTAYALFYRLWRAASELEVPLDSGDFCLLDRKVVAALRRLPERQRFVRGLRAFVGFRQVGVRYERGARHAGASKYTLRGLCRLAADGLVGFSGAPLALPAWLGLATLPAALALALSGATTAAAVFLVGGMQLLSLAVVGAYIRRIFLEAKRRPTYLVARRTGAARRRRRRALPSPRASRALQ